MQNKNISKQEKEDDECNDFLESVGLKSTYYNDFVERYFTKYYINKSTPKEQFIFIHSNGLIVCGFGANHFITQSNISACTDLKKPGRITGRRKHGAHYLNENEYVVQVTYDNGKIFNFCPQLKGKLLEINQNIVDKPNLLNEYPEKYGFVCIIHLDKGVDALREKLEKMQN
jgi:hypothetical protein